MANVIQFKRGNDSARGSLATPADGEPVYVKDTNKLFIGDGSTAADSLSALGGDISLANGSNNRVITATGSAAMNGEANLTFDGSTLAVTGDATVSDDLGLVSDDAQLTFGANSEVKLIHNHNAGLILKHTATGDDKPVSLILQTGETDIAADDVLGKLSFQAPDEGTGTDAILVAAEIAAVSEGDFASGANATSLHFRTGASEAAADKLILTSAGHLTPAADGAQDLGTSSLEFKDGYFDGTLYADAINFNGTAISATAAELNIMDGVTSTAAELNILDGVTSTAAELNILDGVTATAAELNLVDGGTSRGTTAVANGDGFLHNDGGTMRMTNVSKMADLFAGTGISASSSVLSIDAAQTGITSLLATDIKIGEDDQTKIDFETADEIHFYAANAEQVYIGDGIFGPQTDNDVDLGASGAEFKDAYFDGTVTTDALVVGGNTTVQNILAGAVSNTIQFEGSTADNNETTLGVIDPTGDRTINLPNVSGTIPVLAAASTTQISATPAELNVLDGITATVAELNIMDGVTSTAAELNILDGVTSTAAELNILDGVTSTAAELNILDGVTATAAELNLVDGGTSRGTTAVANGDGFLHNDGGTMRMTNVSKMADLFAGTGIDASSAVLSVAAAQTGITSIFATDLKLGEDDQTKIDFETADEIQVYLNNAKDFTFSANTFTALSGSSVVVPAGGLTIGSTAVSSTAAELNILDGVTASTAELNIMDGVTSTTAELNVLDGITAVVGELNLLDMGSTANGTAVASKALVLDSNKDTSGIRNLTISGALDGATIDGGEFS